MRTFCKRALWGTLLTGGITLLGATVANAAEPPTDPDLLSSAVHSTGLFDDALTEQVGDTDPAGPTDPTDPTDPSDPSDPSDPTNPTDPGEGTTGGGSRAITGSATASADTELAATGGPGVFPVLLMGLLLLAAGVIARVSRRRSA